MKKRRIGIIVGVFSLFLSVGMLPATMYATEPPQEQESQTANDFTSQSEGIDVKPDSKMDTNETKEEIQESLKENTQENIKGTFTQTENMFVGYSGHQQTYGNLEMVYDGIELGSVGQSKRMEGLKIVKGEKLKDVNGDICYRVHGQTYGDQAWKSEGQMAGTIGKSKRIEAVQIYLTGDLANQYDIYYAAHIQSFGWLKWIKGSQDDSSWSGSKGLNKRLEALRIVIVPKGGESPSDIEAQYGFITADTGKTIIYNGHQQTYGNLSDKADGEEMGINGKSKRLEALTIRRGANLSEISGDIQYRVHGQNYGTLEWVKNGALAGTVGKSKRIEAVQIALTGDLAEQYDVYYTVHSQKFGWMKWTKGGVEDNSWCGTSGLNLRIESIKIVLVGKDETVPEGGCGWSYLTKDNFGSIFYSGYQQTSGELQEVSDGDTLGVTGKSRQLEAITITLKNESTQPISGDIQYRSHIQGKGWLSWVSNGEQSGTEEQNKRLEAIEIKLTGDLSKYCDVWYRTHVEKYGWLGWAMNGQTAGTTGIQYRMEAIEIKLVPKGSKPPGANNSYYKNVPKNRTFEQLISSINSCKNSSGITTFSTQYKLSNGATARLSSALNDLRSRGYKVSFLMMDLRTGEGITSGSSDFYYSASAIKGPYVCALNYAEPAKASSWRSTMEKTITVSSNSGYESLRNAFGAGAMSIYMAEANVSSFVPSKWYPYMNCKDLAKLWTRNNAYFNSNQANAAWTKSIFTHSQNSVIHAAMANGSTTVYSKPGWGGFGFGSYQNDGGIVVKAGKNPYVVVVMSTAFGQNSKLQELVAAIDMVHNEMN